MARQKKNTATAPAELPVFASRFKDLMDTTGKSISDVSDKTGISKVSLSKYANGSGSANGASLVKLAQCFEVSTDYLLGNDSAAGKKQADAVKKTAQLRAENNRLKRVLLSYESLHEEIKSFNEELRAAF